MTRRLGTTSPPRARAVKSDGSIAITASLAMMNTFSIAAMACVRLAHWAMHEVEGTLNWAQSCTVGSNLFGRVALSDASAKPDAPRRDRREQFHKEKKTQQLP
jgi:hypothetical protein